jgi:hypothetical protein
MIYAASALARGLLSVSVMSSIAPLTSAVCAALLVALLPSSADATGNLAPLPIAAWQGPWTVFPKLELTHPSEMSVFDSLSDATKPRLALALDSVFPTTWTAPERVPLQLELGHAPTLSATTPNGEAAVRLDLPAQVPPLIRYTDETTDVTLSIIPGSPCTGACLKLAGRF